MVPVPLVLVLPAGFGLVPVALGSVGEAVLPMPLVEPGVLPAVLGVLELELVSGGVVLVLLPGVEVVLGFSVVVLL